MLLRHRAEPYGPYPEPPQPSVRHQQVESNLTYTTRSLGQRVESALTDKWSPTSHTKPDQLLQLLDAGLDEVLPLLQCEPLRFGLAGDLVDP